MSGPDAFEEVSAGRSWRQPQINHLDLKGYFGVLNFPTSLPIGDQRGRVNILGGRVLVMIDGEQRQTFHLTAGSLIFDETGQEITLTLRKENPIP